MTGGLPGGILLRALLEELHPLHGQLALLRPVRAACCLCRRRCAQSPRCARGRAPRGARRGSLHELVHGDAIGHLLVLEDLARPAPRGLARARAWSIDHQPARGPAHRRQPLRHLVSGGDEAEIYIEGLAGLVGRAVLAAWPPLCADGASAGHRPASRRMRLTVPGLTSGTQAFALANSSASRCLPQLGSWCRSAMTRSSTAGAVRCGCCGARLANCSSPG